MVVRYDGGKIHIMHLVALVRYARDVVREVGEKGLKGEGNLAEKKEFSDRRLKPKAFKKFFVELKQNGMSEEPKTWELVAPSEALEALERWML